MAEIAVFKYVKDIPKNKEQFCLVGCPEGRTWVCRRKLQGSRFGSPAGRTCCQVESCACWGREFPGLSQFTGKLGGEHLAGRLRRGVLHQVEKVGAGDLKAFLAWVWWEPGWRKAGGVEQIDSRPLCTWHSGALGWLYLLAAQLQPHLFPGWQRGSSEVQDGRLEPLLPKVTWAVSPAAVKIPSSH